MHPDLSKPAGEELYDHQQDTTRYDVDDFEYVNLAKSAEHAAILDTLRTQLVATVSSWQQ